LAFVDNRVLEFHRKHDLALQLVIQARLQGVNFQWVGADGLYGEDPAFLRMLDRMHEIFMVDIHKDQYPLLFLIRIFY